MRRRGARPHPGSGAGQIKEDGSDDRTLYQTKRAERTHVLHGDELRATLVRAVRQGKDPVWLIYFADADVTAEITITPGRASRA